MAQQIDKRAVESVAFPEEIERRKCGTYGKAGTDSIIF